MDFARDPGRTEVRTGEGLPELECGSYGWERDEDSQGSRLGVSVYGRHMH